MLRRSHSMLCRCDSQLCHSLSLRNFARASLRNAPTLRNFALPRPFIANPHSTLPVPGFTVPRLHSAVHCQCSLLLRFPAALRVSAHPCLRSAVHCQRKLLQCLFSAKLSYTVAMQCFAEALLSLALPSLCPSMPSHIETSQCLSHSTPVPSIAMPCHALPCQCGSLHRHALSPPCVAVHVLASASLLNAVLCQSFARLSPCVATACPLRGSSSLRCTHALLCIAPLLGCSALSRATTIHCFSFTWLLNTTAPHGPATPALYLALLRFAGAGLYYAFP